MRVIAGAARGTPLKSPQGVGVRPTLDRVREAVFSILGPRVAGSRFLDLYAGSGANGIEALSRGAAQAVFVDSDGACIRLIEENLARTRLAPAATCIHGAVPKALRLVSGPVDLVYADPPFGRCDAASVLGALTALHLLSSGAWVILEHRDECELPRSVPPFELFDRRRYGQVGVSFFA